MRKLLQLTKVLLTAVLIGVGATSAWADTTVGATDYTTGYLGAKSDAYAINSNGTWTFNFTNYNSGSGNVWNNFLLECNNGVCDEFVLRADNFELVRFANADITTTYAGSNLVTDLNGAAVAMTVTRNGNEIAVAATITPTTGVAAFTYSYTFKRASGNLNLYLSVDNSYLTIQSASWETATGTITETQVVNCDFENSEKLFSEGGWLSVANAADETTSSNVAALTGANNTYNATGRYNFAYYNFASSTSDAALVKVSFDCLLPSTHPQYADGFTIGDASLRGTSASADYSTTGAVFNIAERRISSSDYLYVNNTSKGTESALSSTTPCLGSWIHVEVMADVVNKTASYKVQNLARTSTYYAEYDVAFLDNDVSAVSQIDFQGRVQGVVAKVDNLIITKYVDTSAVPTTYTINYKDSEGNILKDSRVADTYVGVEYTATSSDMATFYNDGETKKYVYNTGNETKTAEATAANNVIDLVFDVYDQFDYTVKAQVDGVDVKTIASGSAYTDGSTTVNFSKYILGDDSKWYVKSASPYGLTITGATNNIEFTEADIYYFIECEATSYSSAGDYPGTGYSGGKTVLLSSTKAMTTTSKIAAGVYDISVYNQVRRANEDQLKLQYSTDNDTWNDVATLTFPSSDATTQTAEKVVLTEDSYIRFVDQKSQNSCHLYDYITLKESTVSKSITAGWATYCSPYALDLSKATGLTDAYIVTGGENGVLKTTSVKSSTVAANTGLLLKCSKGTVTVTIPVVASGTDYTATNKLVGVTASETLTANGGYVLMAEPSVAFYKNTKNFTLTANTAYLTSGFAGATAPAFYSLFDSETTGVGATLVNSERVNNEVFNLQGQRVGQPTKGLYIVNGKKVVKK